MKTELRTQKSEVRRQGLQVRYKLFFTILFALISLLPLSDSFAAPGSFLFGWGNYGTGNSQFYYPHGLTIGGDGNVYVADTANHRVMVFTSNGTFIRKWGSYGSGNGQFKYPFGIAVDGSGNVYVTDSDNNRVQKFDSAGNFIMKWGSYGSGNGQFNFPFGVTLDGSGNVYVVDMYNCRVQVFTSTGVYLRQWGSYGSGVNQLMHPRGIAIDGSGKVYVGDSSNYRIQVFSNTGTPIMRWGSYGSGDGQFYYPVGVAVDGSGNVYVADYINNRIQVFWNTGIFKNKLGNLSIPAGVAVDRCGSKVYVADTGNHRIQVFEGYPTPPSANAGPDQTKEQTSLSGANVTLNGSGSTSVCGGTLTYSWTWSGGSATGANPTVTMPSGTTIVTLTVTSGGSSATDTVSITVQDTIKPITTAVITGTTGDNSWFISDVNISLSATDSGSGVKEIRHSIDGGSEVITAGASVNFTLTTDGSHSVSYYAVDNALNSENPQNRDIRIDKTSPTITATVTPPPNGNDWNNTNVTVTFNCNDGGSGTASCTPPVTVTTEGAGQTVNGSAKDNAGNTANLSVALNIDKTSPSITGSSAPPPNAAGWNNENVTVHFECSDELSGVGTCAADTVLSGDGAGQTVNGTVTDKAGNTAHTTVSGINIDKTPPEIILAVPGQGDVYILNQAVSADYTCSDTGGSGLLSCNGNLPNGASLDTASVGPGAFTVSAEDNAGNTASLTHNYAVIYNFAGFFQPVDNLPTLNVVNAGRSIPVKFSLNGYHGLSILESGYPLSQRINCSTSAVLDVVEETYTAGSSSLSYDPLTDQYIYIWKTEKPWAGTCRQLNVKLIDGTTHTAHFKFR